MKRLKIFISLFFFFIQSPARQAVAPLDPQKKLAQINQTIRSVQSHLEMQTSSAAQLNEQLKHSEKEISTVFRKIYILNKKINQQQARLRVLQKKEGQFSQTLGIQKKKLADLLISAYESKESFIKIILNQENPESFNRMNHYYQYSSVARARWIQSIQKTRDEWFSIRQQIKSELGDLNKLKLEYLDYKSKIKQAQRERKLILVHLKQHIKTEEQQLNDLIQNKKNLEALLLGLSNPQTEAHASFLTLKGKMIRPLLGKITLPFQSRRTPQSLPEQGVFIAAPMNSNIYAVASGRVVFSDWLQGFGMLLIIDHGEGYMSLYAHCNDLLKSVGDKISKGDLIARSGNSGGWPSSGILFEIRKNGKPLNPSEWINFKKA